MFLIKQKMTQDKILKLQAMITQADFLNSETKQVFLNKIPRLNAKKFADLYAIFANDLEERNKLKQKKVEIFEKYKATLTGIYTRAKQMMISLKEKTANKLEEYELKNLNQELNQL